ncbi:hypothetical protein OROHE_010153 [Orobanche hederae]
MLLNMNYTYQEELTDLYLRYLAKMMPLARSRNGVSKGDPNETPGSASYGMDDLSLLQFLSFALYEIGTGHNLLFRIRLSSACGHFDPMIVASPRNGSEDSLKNRSLQRALPG